MKKRGFTLIELMVVVVIIGILAAIAIPNFIKIVDRAKCASVKANQHTMQITVESISIDHMGRYPDGTADRDDIEDELPPNFENPYTGGVIGIDAITMGALASGATGTEGQVYYDNDPKTTYGADGYTINGACKNGLQNGLSLRPGK